jgi:hypothetical protein
MYTFLYVPRPRRVGVCESRWRREEEERDDGQSLNEVGEV